MRPVHQPRRTWAFPAGNRGSRKGTLMHVPAHVCIVDGVPHDLPSRRGLSATVAGTDRRQARLTAWPSLETEKTEAAVSHAGQMNIAFRAPRDGDRRPGESGSERGLHPKGALLYHRRRSTTIAQSRRNRR